MAGVKGKQTSSSCHVKEVEAMLELQHDIFLDESGCLKFECAEQCRLCPTDCEFYGLEGLKGEKKK